MTILIFLCVSIHIMSLKGFTAFSQGEYSCVSNISIQQKTLENGKVKKKKENTFCSCLIFTSSQISQKLFSSTKTSLPLVYDNSSPCVIHFPGRLAPGLGICLCSISISPEGTTGFEDWLSSSGGKACFL